MLPSPVARRAAPCLALCLVLLVPAATVLAHEWDVRITVGPPRDLNTVSTGFGNYPGDHGFVPGYGYYPYYSDHWPTLREALEAKRAGRVAGPSGADFHIVASVQDAVGGPASPDETLSPTAAILRVRVPADAELWFDGARTVQRGAARQFVTPPLEDGRNFSYEVRARWSENGKVVERVETVRVHPGDRLTVDLLAPATGEDAPSLAMPRKATGR
jgi:uncharacterized protein (TIGR03000 family)